MNMNTLKALYRDAIILFMIIVFALGIGEVAKSAIISGEKFKTLIGMLTFSVILAIPITIYRLFTQISAPYCDDVLGGLTTILVSAVIVYTGFVFLDTILIL